MHITKVHTTSTNQHNKGPQDYQPNAAGYGKIAYDFLEKIASVVQKGWLDENLAPRKTASASSSGPTYTSTKYTFDPATGKTSDKTTTTKKSPLTLTKTTKTTTKSTLDAKSKSQLSEFTVEASCATQTSYGPTCKSLL